MDLNALGGWKVAEGWLAFLEVERSVGLVEAFRIQNERGYFEDEGMRG